MFAAKDTLLTRPSGGYQISRSVRFRSSASAYLNRTPTTTGNRRTWTFSTWIKRGTFGTFAGIFGVQISSNGAYTSVFNCIRFTDANVLSIFEFDVITSTTFYRLDTTQVFRDPAAWYHIVFAFDSTQATSSNRWKLYVNGTEVTAFSSTTYPSQNYETNVNTATKASDIGLVTNVYLDGYMTEVNLIDGQALTPSSFGETNAITGVWQPKAYSGTYGTNGFELNFSDNSTAAALGTDFSGNGNTWTVNNISVTAGVTYDSMVDSPTVGATSSNYAVLNPLAVTPVAATFAEANLKVTTGAAGGNAFGTFAIPSSGKWYWEITAGSGTSPYIGISAYLATQTYAWQNTNSVFYSGSNGDKSVDSSASAYGSAYTTNDVIGVAVDVDASTITFYKNNVSQGAISHTFVNVFPCLADGASATTDTFYANFGQRPFSYTPPTGFLAINTQNLPTPTISNGANYMAATTYTGTGSALSVSNAVNGVSFQPDFVWVKGRSGATSHNLSDSVRGTASTLFSNTDGAENVSTQRINAFNSNGFSVGNDTDVSTNTATYVGWQWNAGGSTVTNTSGTISAQVRANATAGFSVATFTKNASTNETIGHGLGVAPKMIIVKTRGSAGFVNWAVWHTSIGIGNFIELNTTAASQASTTIWNNTLPTSTVFSMGTAWTAASNSMVAYCFAAVAGYSAFGSYTGNGSTDGPFVFLGFRPRWVMVKLSSVATTSWAIYDSSRDTYNTEQNSLFADSSTSEISNSSNGVDFLSNGFKLRTTNATWNSNTNTFIYAAFAENPFKLSLAR